MADRDDWPGDPDESWFPSAWYQEPDDESPDWTEVEDDLDGWPDPHEPDGLPPHTIPAVEPDPKAPPPPQDPAIFHVITISNLLDAIGAGGLVARSIVENREEPLSDTASRAAGVRFEDSADQALVAKRRRWRIGCYPYQTLADCVPFYLRRSTPLLRTKLPDRQSFAPRPVQKSPVAVLSLRVSQIHAPWVVIDRHFASARAVCARGPQGLALVDWAATHGPYAKKTSNPDLWLKQQAEVLVYGDVTVEQWESIDVDSPLVADTLRQALGKPGLAINVVDRWFT